MHQYFVDTPITIGQRVTLSKQQEHHAKNVLKMNGDTIRLVHDGIGYFATVHKEGAFYALVTEKDERINELPLDITLALALIRKEKFELVLQKATELGVSRIVPFLSERCVVKTKEEKKERVKERYQAIVLEAAEQCKRNRIPEMEDTVQLADLKDFKSALNVAAYENGYGKAKRLSSLPLNNSVTIVIGPEGGFGETEMKELQTMGYEPVTLGNRILRAETAAICALSILGELGA